MEFKKTETLYEVRRETYQHGKDEQTNLTSYNHKGEYIGTTALAKELCENMGIVPETHGDNKVCTVGFAEHVETWYGWGGGAIAGFKVGHKLGAGDVLLTLKKYKVGEKAKTSEQAKQMAIDFATLADRNNAKQQPHPRPAQESGEEKAGE